MRTICKDQMIYAIIGRVDETKNGWKFGDDIDSPLQWGIGLFQSGVELRPHYHLVRSRLSPHKTREFIYVVKGSVEVSFYENMNLIDRDVLSEGGFVYFIDGTHGLKIIDNDTRLIEVKNGPFVSTEKDKERI